MMDEEAEASTSAVSFRRRAKKNTSTNRKRTAQLSDNGSSSSDTGTVVVKGAEKRKRVKNPMIQSSIGRKIHETKASTSESSSSSNEDEEKGASIEDPLRVTFASSGTAERAGPSDMGATAISEIDTDINCDAQAQFERVQQILKEGHNDKIYRGAALYGANEKKDTVWGNASSGLNRFGPIRAPNFVRQSVRWDFAPDICKDYKETGFCTFGDSCKFLHDRTDYKHGWEIERDYAAGKMKEDDEDKYRISSDDEDQEQEDELPFKCYICRESFVNPVVTKCKHYFCEKCALAHFRKTPKCYICEQNTMGVFNVAKDLITRLKENEALQDDEAQKNETEHKEGETKNDDESVDQ